MCAGITVGHVGRVTLVARQDMANLVAAEAKLLVDHDTGVAGNAEDGLYSVADQRIDQ
jgi:hypothetical protein